MVNVPVGALRVRIAMAWHLLRGRPVIAGMAVIGGEIYVDAWRGRGGVHGNFKDVHWHVQVNPDRSQWARLYGAPSAAGPADFSRAVCPSHKVHPQRRADGGWYCPMGDELLVAVHDDGLA